MKRLFLVSLLFSTQALGGDFKGDLDRDADRIRVDHPEIAARVDGMSPLKNRAGMLAFPGGDLVDPRAQVLIQDRLLDGGDDALVRTALAYALDDAHRIPWAVAAELEPKVRAALISGYKKAGDADALAAFESALQDESLVVRVEAARLIGYRPDLVSETLLQGLASALSDQEADVRRFGVRSVSWRQDPGGFDRVEPLLGDASAQVRGAAVRALGKLDRERAAALPELQALSSDADPRVKRSLKRVLSP